MPAALVDLLEPLRITVPAQPGEIHRLLWEAADILAAGAREEMPCPDCARRIEQIHVRLRVLIVPASPPLGTKRHCRAASAASARPCSNAWDPATLVPRYPLAERSLSIGTVYRSSISASPAPRKSPNDRTPVTAESHCARPAYNAFSSPPTQALPCPRPGAYQFSAAHAAVTLAAGQDRAADPPGTPRPRQDTTRPASPQAGHAGLRSAAALRRALLSRSCSCRSHTAPTKLVTHPTRDSETMSTMSNHDQTTEWTIRSEPA
ncbi:hypothetical protein J2S48_000705 [Promicromonospora iranensis]|uniref:Zinc finger protein n=1 Tax=Promicromonospora iranensis TaxID=1105144 RepID=A0ABU2CIN3_9MICO|nr:hypothetical protein [Promicromonospora iranensis]